ncbi:MAG: two-component regulator propeller domain-containing protein, partial [Gammaproteobacteria bacterium]
MFPSAGRIVALFGLLILIPSIGRTQAPGLEFGPVGENRGLEVAMPVDLLFDRRGFLWVGGRTGLYRYDGYRAVLFEPEAGNPDSITDLDIRALYEDAEGHIWVATNTGGLNRLDPVTGGFSHFRHRPGDPTSISHDSVYEMTEGPDGDLWAGTQIGLSRIDGQSGEVTRYFSDPDDPGSLGDDYVFSVYRDRQDVLWIATVGGGLNRYNTTTDDFTRFDLATASGGSAQRNDVFQIAEDGEGRLWIGTREGLLRLDRNRVNFALVDLGLPGTAQPTITEILIDSDDNVWAGTLNSGVVRIDAASGVATAYTDYDAREIGGLATQPVLSLAMFGDQLFVGTWGAGLWSARIPDNAFAALDSDNTELRNDLVTAVTTDPVSGAVLAGSFGGGVQVIDVDAGSAGDLPSIDPALKTAGVLDIVRHDDGTLFVGTDEGLYELAADGSLREHYEHDPDDELSIGEGYITSLLLTDGSTLWVGAGGSGLFRLNLSDRMITGYGHASDDPASLSGNYITSLLADGRDRLWVGTRSNGLNVCERRTMRCRRFSSDPDAEVSLGHFHVTALFRDSRERLWVATDGGGLHQVMFAGGDDTVTGLRRWTEKDGLLSDSVMAVEEDSDGSLWLSSRHGLTRLDPDQARVVNYVEAGGLPVDHFNVGAADHDADFLYFGSVRGLLVIPRG